MKSKILVTSENDLVKIYTADFLEKEKQRCEMDRPVADFRILIHKSAHENHNLHNRFLQDLTNMFLMKERTFNNKNNEDTMRYKLIGSLSSKRIKPVEQKPGNTDHIINTDRENYLLLKKETELFLKRETEFGKAKLSTERIQIPKVISEVNNQKSQIKHVSSDDGGFTYKFVETKSENRSSVQVKQSVHSYTINKQTVSKQTHNKKTVTQQLITKQQKEHVTQSKSIIQSESPMTQSLLSPTNISKQTKSNQTQITKTIRSDLVTEPPNVEISYLQNVRNTEPIINQAEQLEMNSAPIKIQNISQESNIKFRDDFILLKETVQRFLDNHKNHNDVEQQAFAHYQSSKFIKPQSDKQQSKVEMGVVSKSTKNPKKGIIGKIKNFIGLKGDKHSKANQVNSKVTRDTCESFLKREKEYSDSDILTTLGFREPSKEIDSVTIFGSATEKSQTLPVRSKSIENRKSESDLKANQNAPEKETVSKLKTILGIPKLKPSKKPSGEKVIIPSETDDFEEFNTIRPDNLVNDPNLQVESEKCLETASEQKVFPLSVSPTSEKIPEVSEASNENLIHISTNSPQMQTPKAESDFPKQSQKESSVKKTQFHPFGKIRTKSQSKEDFEELKKQTDKFLLVQKNYSDLEKEAHEVFLSHQMNTVKRRKPPPIVARVSTPLKNLKTQNEEEMYNYWRNQTKLFLDYENKYSDAYRPKQVIEKIVEKEEYLKLNNNRSKSPNMKYEKQVSKHIEPVQEYQLPTLNIPENLEIKRRLLKRIHLDSQNIHRIENFEYLNTQTNKFLINERKYSSYERDFYENLYNPRQSAIEENIENKEIQKVDTEKPKPVDSKVGVLKRLKSLVHINGEKSVKNVNSNDQLQQLKSNSTQFLINEKKYSDIELGAYYNFLQKSKISLNESYVIENIEPIQQLPLTKQIVATNTEIIKNPPKKHIDSKPKKLTEKENYIYLNTQTDKFLIIERKYSDFLGDFYEHFYRPKTAVIEGNIEKKVDVKVSNEKQKSIDSGNGMLSKLKNIVHISGKSPRKINSKDNYEHLKSDTYKFLNNEKKYNDVEGEAYLNFLRKYEISVQNNAMEGRKPVEETLVSKQTVGDNMGMKKLDGKKQNLHKENTKENFSGNVYENLYIHKTGVIEGNIEKKVDMKISNEKQEPIHSGSGMFAKLKNIVHISEKTPKKMDTKDNFEKLKSDTNHFLMKEKKYNDLEGEAYHIFLKKYNISIIQNEPIANRKQVHESLVSKQTVGDNMGMKKLDGKKQIDSNLQKENTKENFSGNVYENLYIPKTGYIEGNIEKKVDLKISNEKHEPIHSGSGMFSKLKNIVHISEGSPKKMDTKDNFEKLKSGTNHFLMKEKKYNDLEGEAYHIFMKKYNLTIVQNEPMVNRKQVHESLVSKQTFGEILEINKLDGKKQIRSNSMKDGSKEEYEYLNTETNKFLTIEKKYSDFSGDFYEKLYKPTTTVSKEASIEKKVDMKVGNEKQKPVDSENGILSKLKNIVHISGKSPKKMDSKDNFKQLKLDTNHFLIKEKKYNDLEGEAYQIFLKKFNIPVVQNKAMEDRKPIQESLVSKQTVGENLGMKKLDGKKQIHSNSKKEGTKEEYEYVNTETNKFLTIEKKYSDFTGDFYEKLFGPKTNVLEEVSLENKIDMKGSKEKQKPVDSESGILSKLKNIIHISGKSPKKMDSKDIFKQLKLDTNHFLIEEKKYNDLEGEAYQIFLKKFNIPVVQNKAMENHEPIQESLVSKQTVGENLGMKKLDGKKQIHSNSKKEGSKDEYEYLNTETNKFLTIEKKYSNFSGDFYENLYKPKTAIIEGNTKNKVSNEKQNPPDAGSGILSKLKNIVRISGKSPTTVNSTDNVEQLISDTNKFLIDQRKYDDIEKEAHYNFMEKYKINSNGNKIPEIRSFEQTPIIKENVRENLEMKKTVLKGDNDSKLKKGNERENYEYICSQTNKFLIIERKYSEKSPHIEVIEKNVVKTEKPKLSSANQKPAEVKAGFFSKFKNIKKIDTMKSPQKADWYDDNIYLSAQTDAFLVKERTYNNLYKEACENFLCLSKKDQADTMPSRGNISENIVANKSLLISGVSKSAQNKEANEKDICIEHSLITSPSDITLGNEKNYHVSQGRDLENCKLTKSIPIEIPVTHQKNSETNSPNAESPPKDHKNIKQKALSKLKTIIGRSDDKPDKKPKTSESEFVSNSTNSFLLNEKRFYDSEKRHHHDLEPKNMKRNLQPLQNKIVSDEDKQQSQQTFQLDKNLTSQFMHDFKRHSDLEKEEIEKFRNKFNESSKERTKEPVLTKFKNIIGLGKENTTKRKQKESYEILKLQTEKFISNHKQHHDLERQAHHNLKKSLLFNNAERIQTVNVTDLGTAMKANIRTVSNQPNAIIENHEFIKKATNKFLENEKNSWDFQRDNYETYKLVNAVVRAENKGNVIKITNPIATSNMISKKPSMDGSKDAKNFTHIRNHTNDFLMREKAFSDLQMGDYHNYKTIIYVNNNINEMPRRNILQGNRDQTPVYREEPRITRNEESSTVREDAKNVEEKPFEASLVESVQTIPILTQNANTADAQNKPQPKKRTIKESIVPKLKSFVPHKKNQRNEEAKVFQQVKDDIQRFLHMERQSYALEHPDGKNSKIAMNPPNNVEKRIYPVGDHGETEAAGKKSNRKDVASPDKIDKHSKTKHRLLPKLFGKSSAKSKTSDENFALIKSQMHEFLTSERKSADSELKYALKFPKSPEIEKKQDENIIISVRTPVMTQQKTSLRDQRERQQNFEHLKAETISFLLSQKDYSDFEREGMEKYRLTTVTKSDTLPEESNSTLGQSPSKKKEPYAHRKVFSMLKNFATGADKLSQKHQDREHLEYLKKITNDFLISQKVYSNLEVKASEKFRKRQITYAPTPTKMKFAHKDSLKLVNATPGDRETHNTQTGIGSNLQLQPVDTTDQVKCRNRSYPNEANQKFQEEHAKSVTTSNKPHSELQMQTADPVIYIPVPHKKEEVIKLKQFSDVDLQKSSSKSAANINAKSAVKDLGNNTNLRYNVSKEKKHPISKTETEVFLENQKLYSDAQKEEYVKFRTAEILESRNLVKDSKKMDLMKPVTLLLNTNTFLLNEKKYGHSEELNENIFNRRKSHSTEKIVERKTFNKKTVPKINTTMSQLLSKDPVRISEMSQDWTAVFLENERNHGLPLRKENQTETGRLSSNSSTSLQGNRPKNEIQNLIRKTNKEIMLDSPDSQVTETRIYCDGLTTSRYITKCYIEPVSTPVWYTESLLLDIETKQQKTDEKIYYENKFRPNYWSETFITNISPKTDVCLAEASFPMEKSDVHYISLEPQQVKAIDIGIN